MNTYWIRYPRDFANEYTIGVATTVESARLYQDDGYERIARKRALERMTNRGDSATKVYVGVTLDGRNVMDTRYAGRHELAREIRAGTLEEV